MMARKTSAGTHPGRPPKRIATDGAPASVEAALAAALQHTQAALAEGLLAARSLLDAISLSLYGEPASQLPSEGDERTQGGARRSDGMQAIAAMARTLESFASRIRGEDESLPVESILVALLDALDAEISRWEAQSKSDTDARAVLRAFLGMREILWELGVRRPANAPHKSGHRDESGSAAAGRPKTDSRRTPDRRADRAAEPAPKSEEAAPPKTDPPNRPGPRRSRRPRVQRVEVQE